MRIFYSYFSQRTPVLLPYTLFFMRRIYEGPIIFCTNKDFPDKGLFEEYNVTRINGLDDYKNLSFYNEYKVLGIQDFAEEGDVYLDLDIFFDSPKIFDTMGMKTNFFANKFYGPTVFLGLPFFDDPPLFGYNGGIIKLSGEVKKRYCKKSLEMFDIVRPLAGKIQYIDCVAEELLAATFPEISYLGQEGFSSKDPGWVHLMEPTPLVLRKLEIYKEMIQNDSNQSAHFNFNEPVLSPMQILL